MFQHRRNVVWEESKPFRLWPRHPIPTIPSTPTQPQKLPKMTYPRLPTRKEGLMTRRTTRSPLCVSDYVKLQSHWSCDESEQVLLSISLLFIFVCIWHTPMWSCPTLKLWPSFRRKLDEACVHTWSKMVSRMTRRRFNVTRRYLNSRAQTRKPVK
jgi:hypothetical protein